MSWGSSCLSILLSVAQMVTPSTVDMWFVQRWGLISEPTWAQRSAGVGLIAEKIPGFTFGTVPGELMGLGRASQENLPSTRLHLSAFSKSYQVNANLNSHLGICRYNCIKHCALNYIHTWIWIQSLQKDYICQAISKMHPPLKNQCWDAPPFSLET